MNQSKPQASWTSNSVSTKEIFHWKKTLSILDHLHLRMIHALKELHWALILCHITPSYLGMAARSKSKFLYSSVMYSDFIAISSRHGIWGCESKFPLGIIYKSTSLLPLNEILQLPVYCCTLCRLQILQNIAIKFYSFPQDLLANSVI